MYTQTLRLAILLAIGCNGTVSPKDTVPDTVDTTDTDTDTSPWTCADPTPLLQQDGKTPTGFVQCADGITDRVEAVTCNPPDERSGATCPESFSGCSSDADCTDGVNGRCDPVKFSDTCSCSYGCATDDDCGEGAICLCAGVGSSLPVCVSAGCTTSDDCGDLACSFDDALCSYTYAPGRVACRTEADECILSNECEHDTLGVRDCGLSSSGAWECRFTDYCGDGRPFLVEGRQRVAPLSAGASGWWEGLPPRTAHLSAQTRAALADAWARAGQDEHASIASFARFTLQLLALGAPPELLADTQRATQDEIRHAQQCFRLASAYAGRPVGPGPLDTADALAMGTAPLVVVEAVIAEACIGETLAAAMAAASAEDAEDPAVRAVLKQIADDEQQHALLGWRFLRWWLQGASAADRAVALGMLSAALERLPTAPLRGDAAGLRRHGRLDLAARERVRAAVLADVLRPAWQALCARFGGSAHSLTRQRDVQFC